MSHEHLTCAHAPDHTAAYQALEVLRAIVVEYAESGKVALSPFRLTQAIRVIEQAPRV